MSTRQQKQSLISTSRSFRVELQQFSTRSDGGGLVWRNVVVDGVALFFYSTTETNCNFISYKRVN